MEQPTSPADHPAALGLSPPGGGMDLVHDAPVPLPTGSHWETPQTVREMGRTRADSISLTPCDPPRVDCIPHTAIHTRDPGVPGHGPPVMPSLPPDTVCGQTLLMLYQTNKEDLPPDCGLHWRFLTAVLMTKVYRASSLF